MRNRTETQMTFVLIRHGQTRANEERRYLGKTDESLSDKGRMALLRDRDRNRYPQADYLFTSPMRRCLETAQILYPRLCPVIIPEWTEMDFGVFEYKNYEEAKSDARYQAWIDSGGLDAFPGGESREDFIRRCERGWRRLWAELAQRAGDSGKTAAVVVHGGTVMALLGGPCGERYFDYQVSCGGGYLCRAGNRRLCGEKEGLTGLEVEAGI